MKRINKKVLSLLLLTIINLIAAAQVFSQTNEISGRAADQNGAAVVNANVVLRNTETGLERFAKTDREGKFVFRELSGENFEVTVNAEGFAVEVEAVSGGKNISIVLVVAPLAAETVVYSGSRQEELRESLNTKVEVVTRAEIEETGYETIGEVLKEVPGVMTRRGSQTGTSSGAAGEQIQGIGSRQSLVLIDNFPVIGARGIKSGVINLDRQSTNRIEQIEVVKGAASALYGSDAIGGVVNLITREPKRPLEATITVSGGNFGVFDPRADFGFKRKTFSGFTSFERHKNNGYDLTPTTFDTTGAGFHRYNFFNKLKYEFTPDFYISTLADIQTENAKGRSVAELGSQFDDVDTTTQSYGLTANWTINPRTVLQTRGYFSRYDEIYRAQKPNGTPLADDNLFQRYGLLDATLTHVLGERQLIQIGGEWRTDRYRGINRLRSDDGERADTSVVWGQDKISLTNWATVTVGLRYDKHSVFGSALSPKVGLNVRVNENLNLRASFGRGFRAPDLGQLYYRLINRFIGYQVVGNPNLRPENSNSWQVGAEYAQGQKKYRFGVNFFRNDVRNLIDLRNLGFVTNQAQLNAFIVSENIDPSFRLVPFGFLFLQKNLSNIFTQGAEFDGEIKLPKNFAVSAAYTYLDARDKSNGSYLLDRNKHQAFLKLAYANAENGFRANLRGSYFSNWKTAGGRNSPQNINIPGFALWDVYAAKRLKNRFEVFGTVENLFDNQDRNVGLLDAANNPLPIYRNDAGRMFRLGLRINLFGEK